MLDRVSLNRPARQLTVPKVARRIVICGSMTFYGEMLRLRADLERASVPAVLPDAENEHVALLDQPQYESFKRRVSLAHLRRVRHRSTFAVLVLNLDKHGTPDYIGASVYAEIAMASAFHKPVYLLGDYPDAYAEDLAAWGAVALNGRLDQLVEDHWSSCVSLLTPQMGLFGST